MASQVVREGDFVQDRSQCSYSLGKFGHFLPKLRQKLAPELIAYYMELFCCGREALSVYTESKKLLDHHLSLRTLEESLRSSGVDKEDETLAALNCHCCSGFIIEPVCLPCGHSLCTNCIQKTVSNGSILRKQQIECPTCKQRWNYHGRDGTGRHSNVLLTKIWNKSFPKRRKAFEHKEDGNKLATEKDFPLAIESYTKALQEEPLEHRALSNRSRALLILQSQQEALKDAQDCCTLKPLWPKGHFRRGAALEELGKFPEAASAYLLCLHLGGSDCSVQKKLCKLLKKILEDSTGHREEKKSSLVQDLVRMSVQSMEAVIQAYHSHMPQMKQVLRKFEVEDGDLDCVLCAGILLNPVTTFCGHTFCRSCLCRSFDHTPSCPVCRSLLEEMFELQLCGRMAVDQLTSSVVQHCFKEAHAHKYELHEAEKRKQNMIGLSSEVPLPVFPCTMAFPGMPCPLHIFEPRYRMLIRHCMESSRRFGMCGGYSDKDDTFNEYGTVLYIKTVEYTMDGRSLVTTVGEKRFKVLEHWKEEGLHLARVEYIEDEEIEEKDIDAIRGLQEEVFQHAKLWLSALPSMIKMCIMQSVCCPIPTDSVDHKLVKSNGPDWLWWFVSAIPVTETKKMEFLTCTSTFHRLKMLQSILPLPGES